jgi:hypothetical protein
MSAPNSVQHDLEKTDSEPKSNAVPMLRTDSFLDDNHVMLTWRSWLVVFISCFAIFSQVFVVVAAGSVIAFIIRDLGEPAIAGASNI